METKKTAFKPEEHKESMTSVHDEKYRSIQEVIDNVINNGNANNVSIRGWIYRERGSKKLRFLVLRDSTNIIQCIVKKEDVSEAIWDAAEKLQIEASVLITGDVKVDKRAPTGIELTVKELSVIGPSNEFPIQKDNSTEWLADNRHLWLRSRRMTAIMKIRSTVFQAIDEYFKGEGFYEYHSPIFQSVQCEGGSTLFGVNYFDKKDVFLAQTWQLYAEPAIFALEKIYTIAPSFRAEKSKTSRHLTEYWHAEMEVAWATFADIQNYGEELIKFVFKKVIDNNKAELEILERDLSKIMPIVEKPFIRMTYTEALKVLKEKKGIDIEWGKDLRTIEEDELSKLYDVPIICTHYPKVVKAFYMTETPGDPNTVLGCDFIGTESYGEIIGGSHREHDLEKIKARLEEEGEDIKEYKFYLDTRKYGSIPHGGFGMGVERLITWVCGLDNIKDSIPFPRTMLRYKP